ncbi:hypothetical protein SAMN05444274_103237 [Mariniphaga anaerophila]|uniref:Uncharacterized protein n=1 Tax=Mariniphaga anaerophila TaxID=1484053 RepID=A0A1M4Y5G4_9BACT|nr:hypothetical protein SAMN05444274_103237 [Mariniphaga anaerophila]
MQYNSAKNKGDGQNDVLLEHAFRQLHSPLFFYALKFVGNDEPLHRTAN